MARTHDERPDEPLKVLPRPELFGGLWEVAGRSEPKTRVLIVIAIVLGAIGVAVAVRMDGWPAAVCITAVVTALVGVGITAVLGKIGTSRDAEEESPKRDPPEAEPRDDGAGTGQPARAP